MHQYVEGASAKKTSSFPLRNQYTEIKDDGVEKTSLGRTSQGGSVESVAINIENGDARESLLIQREEEKSKCCSQICLKKVPVRELVLGASGFVGIVSLTGTLGSVMTTINNANQLLNDVSNNCSTVGESDVIGVITPAYLAGAFLVASVVMLLGLFVTASQTKKNN